MGKDVRSGQARGLRQELRDQASEHAAARTARPRRRSLRDAARDRRWRRLSMPISAARGRRVDRAVRRVHPAGTSPRAAPARRQHGSGIRQADGRDRDRRASRRCRARSTSAPSCGSTCSDPFYDSGPNDKGIGIQLAYSIARVAVGYLLAVAGRDPDRLPDRHVAADEPGARSRSSRC